MTPFARKMLIMRIRPYFLILLVPLLAALSVFSCHSSRPNDSEQYSVVARRLLPSAGLRDTVSYLLGVNFAAFVHYGGGGTDGDDFGEIDFMRVKEGIDDFIAADADGRYMEFVRSGFTDPDYVEFASKMDIDPAMTDSLVMLYLQARMDARARDNQEKGRAFFEANRDQSDVQEISVRYPNPDNLSDSLSASIQYKMLQAGTGAHVVMGDSLLLSYKAYRLGSEVPFDQVDSLGVSSLTDSTFLRGFTAGLLRMRNGARMEIYVPSELGFGLGRTSEGRAFFSPYATLVFDVTLHERIRQRASGDDKEVDEY